MSVVHRLRHYYNRKSISVFNFNCPHYFECKAGHKSFAKAREAYIGRYYEETRPRLLFLSADPGSERKLKREHNMIAVRIFFQGFRPKKKDKHWYWTLMLALELLRPFGLFREGDEEESFEKVVRYIAHTNSGKCCQNKPGKAEADPILFRNCEGFILGELEILEPRVIVTQGAKAKKVLEACEETEETIPGRRRLSNTRIVRISDRRVLWIHTYHPAQKQYYFHKYDWPKREHYSGLIEGFLQAYR